MALHAYGTTYQYGFKIDGQDVKNESHLPGMAKESIDKMSQKKEPIWKNVEDSIIYNSDAYL